MNLLDESWMPVRLHGGAREWIAPHRLSDPRVAGFDADRADFNGALAQFAIGLLQTTTPVDSSSAWRKLFEQPPDADALDGWFSPHAAAFEFDGDGARFMQDFELRVGDSKHVSIGSLLIDAPGENTIEKNRDHFVKRGAVSQMCTRCACTALFTLQVNGPSVGAGYRTGLRGAGPITTLLATSDVPVNGGQLWRDLWLNVQTRSEFLANGGDDEKEAVHFSFPWMAPMNALQKEGGEIAPIQVHPAHVFWGMPNRIRIDFSSEIAGTCHVCREDTDRLVQRYTRQNHGLNYKGPWSHPLSPHRRSDDGLLPMRTNSDGVGFRHWLGWAIGMSTEKTEVRSASAIDSALNQRAKVDLRIWAFGYHMENATAVCWHDGQMPLYDLVDVSPSARRLLRDEVGALLAGLKVAANLLADAVKEAWFSERTTKVWSADRRREFASRAEARLWGVAQIRFYSTLRALIRRAVEGQEQRNTTVVDEWAGWLRATAIDLFDREFVGTSPIQRQNPQRISRAHNRLNSRLNGSELRAALGLPIEAKPSRKAKAPAAKTP